MNLKFSDEHANAYEDFKKNDDINFVVFTTAKDGPAKTLSLDKSCSSGIEGLKQYLKENFDDQIAFAVLKVKGVDERGGVKSVRQKFVFVSFIGKSCPPLRKARASTTSPMVKVFVGSLVQYSVQVYGSEIDSDFTPKAIGKMLLNAGGAHKPKYYDFGGDSTISVDELY